MSWGTFHQHELTVSKQQYNVFTKSCRGSQRAVLNPSDHLAAARVTFFLCSCPPAGLLGGADNIILQAGHNARGVSIDNAFAWQPTTRCCVLTVARCGTTTPYSRQSCEAGFTHEAERVALQCEPSVLSTQLQLHEQ